MDNTICKNITEIKLTYIFINNVNEVDKVSQEMYNMITPNIISKEEIIKLLKNNINKKEIKKYTISSLLQYNVDIETGEFAENYLNEEYMLDELNCLPFLHIIKEIRNIYWKPCLSVFKELNELFIIYYENLEIKNNNITKRIYMNKIKNKTYKNKL
jgi:hypothetical protein